MRFSRVSGFLAVCRRHAIAYVFASLHVLWRVVGALPPAVLSCHLNFFESCRGHALFFDEPRDMLAIAL